MKKNEIKEQEHFERRMRKLENWIESSADVINHKSSLGADTENIVKEMIREYLPGKFGVETGFVRSLEDPKWQSKQIDILFTLNDQGFPLATLLSCKVFPIEAVLGVMEITKSLNKNKIAEDFKKVSSLLEKHKRFASTSVSDHIEKLESLRHCVDDKDKEQFEAALENLKIIKEPRNQRMIVEYGDMPPRFFYFAVNSIKDPKILLDHIKKNAEAYNIKIHGMFILDQRMFITNVGEYQYYKDEHQAFPFFINRLIDSLITYGDIPGVIPFDRYYNIDENKLKTF